jgi:hypothetical protein
LRFDYFHPNAMILTTQATSPFPFWTSQAQQLASKTRYIDPISGIRFYPIEVGGRILAVPGVTSLLGALEPSESKQRLEEWRLRELAAGRDPNAGRERGTRVHGLLEDVIRTGVAQPSCQEDADFFSGMEQYIRSYDEFLWNERPLLQGWEHCWSAPEGDPARLARVWSATWGYAGTPDLIARRRGTTILGDFKTSNRPYYRCHGTKVPRHHETGYKKYVKTVRQLCAYRLAIQEVLGIEIHGLQIIVGLPGAGEAQQFYIQGPEMERETESVKRAAVEFWKLHGQTHSAAAAALPADPVAVAA